jgi:hypothetical protein
MNVYSNKCMINFKLSSETIVICKGETDDIGISSQKHHEFQSGATYKQSASTKKESKSNGRNRKEVTCSDLGE